MQKFREFIASYKPPALPVAETSTNWDAVKKSLESSDNHKKLQALRLVRKYVSKPDTSFEVVFTAGLVPLIVSVLTETAPKNILEEAIWCVTNMASGSTKETTELLDLGIIEKLGKVAKGQSDKHLLSSIFWAIGNIAGELNPDTRHILVQEGFVDLALKCLNDDTTFIDNTFINNIGFFIMNVARTKPKLSSETILPMLPGICKCINRFPNNEEILNTYLYALNFVTDINEDMTIDSVLEQGMCPILVNLCDHHSSKVHTPALRCVGNIASHENLHTQVLLDVGLLEKLKLLLESQEKGIRKEVCWILSNITAGTPVQAKSVVDSGLFDRLIEICGSEAEAICVRKEAIWAIANASFVLKEPQDQSLMVEKVLPKLVELLDDTLLPMDIFLTILEGIEQILGTSFGEAAQGYLKQMKGIEALSKATNFSNKRAAKKAKAILETYFS